MKNKVYLFQSLTILFFNFQITLFEENKNDPYLLSNQFLFKIELKALTMFNHFKRLVRNISTLPQYYKKIFRWPRTCYRSWLIEEVLGISAHSMGVRRTTVSVWEPLESRGEKKKKNESSSTNNTSLCQELHLLKH